MEEGNYYLEFAAAACPASPKLQQQSLPGPLNIGERFPCNLALRRSVELRKFRSNFGC